MIPGSGCGRHYDRSHIWGFDKKIDNNDCNDNNEHLTMRAHEWIINPYPEVNDGLANICK